MALKPRFWWQKGAFKSATANDVANKGLHRPKLKLPVNPMHVRRREFIYGTLNKEVHHGITGRKKVSNDAVSEGS
jgi:hypothetical protein